MTNILIGTSSWSNHEPFYPPGVRGGEQLSYYAKFFPVVEINMTYYRLPTTKMAEGWVKRTPDDFIFDVKPPRELTSTPERPGEKPPEPDADIAQQFAEGIKPLHDAGKLGAVTFQFPPSYRNTEEHREYLKLLPELFPDYHIAVEFRRRDWLDEEHADQTLDLLQEAGMSYTMADEPQMGSGSVPPVYGVTNPRLSIIRFHGRNYETWYKFTGSSEGRFNWEYSVEEFAEWMPKIRSAMESAATVHVFMNTNYGDQGPSNALRLMEMMGLLPELGPEDGDAEQQSMFE